MTRNRRRYGSRDYWLRLGESQRITRQLEREREAIGARALSAQLSEFACGSDAGELAELFADRLDGLYG
jgi:hypothetical protein